jgi:CheY-like chemotaxis protein
LEGLSVLVVDDEADALRLVRRVLVNRGADVELASSVSEAVTKFTSHPPDVLVSDIGMPGQDGYELIRQIRSLPRESGGTTPAAALTAFARFEDRRRAMLAGFQSHIAKPVEPSELVAVIATLAGRTGR